MKTARRNRQLTLNDITRPPVVLTAEQAATLGWMNPARDRAYLHPALDDLPGVTVDWGDDGTPRNVTVLDEPVSDALAMRMVRFLSNGGAVIHWSADTGRLDFYSRQMTLPYKFAGVFEDYLWAAAEKAAQA